MDRVRALNDDDEAWDRWFGPWAPLSPTEVGKVLAEVDATWWIVGGWAIDAFARRPRAHHDIDVGFFRTDLGAILQRLAPEFCVWSNASGTLRPLMHPDDLLPECRQIWVRRDGASPWLMDLAMTPGDGTTWISPLDETLRVPIDEAVFEATDGVRYLAPEIILSFKARHHRPQDEGDFDVTLPLLDIPKRRWLREAIERDHADDPWLARLGTIDPPGIGRSKARGVA